MNITVIFGIMDNIYDYVQDDSMEKVMLLWYFSTKKMKVDVLISEDMMVNYEGS